jgi:hypothetical protein
VVDAWSRAVRQRLSLSDQCVLEPGNKFKAALWPAGRNGDATNTKEYVDMLRRAMELGGFHQVIFICHTSLQSQGSPAATAVALS